MHWPLDAASITSSPSKSHSAMQKACLFGCPSSWSLCLYRSLAYHCHCRSKCCQLELHNFGIPALDCSVYHHPAKRVATHSESEYRKQSTVHGFERVCESPVMFLSYNVLRRRRLRNVVHHSEGLVRRGMCRTCGQSPDVKLQSAQIVANFRVRRLQKAVPVGNNSPGRTSGILQRPERCNRDLLCLYFRPILCRPGSWSCY